MTVLWISWAGAALVILAAYWWAGRAARSMMLGILIDSRGRFSLTRLQLSLWTLVVLSLLAGVFTARAFSQGVAPMAFSIPGPVLGTLGISVGSAAIATGIKVSKDRTRPEFIAASEPGQARPAQMVLVEEGANADKTVDVAKLQNFLITLFLTIAYVALSIHAFAGWDPGKPIAGPGDIGSLPDFNATFLTLLAISHAGYLVAKTPNRGEDTTQDVPEKSVADLSVERTLRRERGESTERAGTKEQLRAADRKSALALARGQAEPPEK